MRERNWRSYSSHWAVGTPRSTYAAMRSWYLASGAETSGMMLVQYATNTENDRIQAANESITARASFGFSTTLPLEMTIFEPPCFGFSTRFLGRSDSKST